LNSETGFAHNCGPLFLGEFFIHRLNARRDVRPAAVPQSSTYWVHRYDY
jgi:hypothetical protein